MDTSPRTYRFLPSDLYTSGYRIVGKVMATTSGIMGIMNDPTRSFIEIHDARLARIHMPTKLVDHYEVVRVVKQHVFAVCTARREDLGPTAILRGGYSNITSMPARLASQVYEVDGKLEMSGRFDFAALIADKTRNFIPVFESVLTAILIPNVKVESPAILFNREHVDMIALNNQRAKDDK
jgi:hypothetical protein